MSALAARFSPMFGALGLPPSARVERRIPKDLLLKQAPPADHRAVTEGVEALGWLAALRPDTVGIAASADGAAPEVEVIGVELREGALAERIVERIHRAMPYPLLVIEASAGGQRASVGWKRPASRGEARLVLAGPVEWGPRVEVADGRLLPGQGPDAEALQALALRAQADVDLGACYRGFGWTLMAWRAARITGTFRPPADESAAAQLSGLLEAREALLSEARSVERELGRAAQLRQQVELRQRHRALGELLAANMEALDR